MIDPTWLPHVPMRRIHWHWTAGTHTPNDTDRRAYHLLIDGNGRWHRSIPGIELNSGALKPGYAAHTLNANSDAIGISLCGMAGAVEAPYGAGRWPIRPEQIAVLVAGCRQLGEVYGIPVTRKTMLSHAEVQPTLGIKQNAKWDWTRLPDDVTQIRGGLAIGDWIRGRIAGEAAAPSAAPIPAGATARVSASSLITRNAPDGQQIGSLPRGTLVTVLEQRAPWLQVRSPAGFLGWVHGDHLDIIDGPLPAVPSVPDPRRALIADFRAYLDQIEATL